MADFGFYIRKIVIEGNNKSPIDPIILNRGVNYIYGPSDTGKSHLFKTINFLLGGSQLDQLEPEGRGYDQFFMEIETYKSNIVYTLYKTINPKSHAIKKCSISDFCNEKYEKIVTNEDDYNDFLLNQCIKEKTYIKYKRGVNRRLRYTYLRKLTVIPTEQITSINSPFYPTNQHIDKVLYCSLIKYLLTGIGCPKDSKEISAQEEKLNKAVCKVKKEFIEEQINELQEELSNHKVQLIDSCTKNHLIASLTQNYDNVSNEVESKSSERSCLAHEKNKLESELLYYKEFVNRLGVLLKQYDSDLERLSFIDEGQFLLAQLNTVKCPICSQEITLTKNQITNIEKNISIGESIEAEKKNIISKRKDLLSTISSNKETLLSITEKIKRVEEKINQISNYLNEYLQPQRNNIKNSLKKLEAIIGVEQQRLFIQNRIAYLNNLKSRSVKNQDEESQELLTTEGIEEIPYKNVCQILSDILKKINYLRDEKVIFNKSKKEFDFIFGIKKRSSYGAGMRGISYSAVLISLLLNSVKKGIPSNRILVLDSPVTAYKAKKAQVNSDDILPEDIAQSFFKYLSQSNFPFQLIIFDNKKIEDKATSKGINTIEFTGNPNLGRYGLFPKIQD